jgi:hypothetical protein
MRAQRTKRATARVMRWCDLYLRGVSADVADARREELLRDIEDQAEWSARNNISDRRVARSIYIRAVMGAPADLSWRMAQRTGTSLDAPPMRAFSIGLLSLTATSGFALLFVACVSLVRHLQGTSTVNLAKDPAQFLVLISVIALMLGEALLVRQRTRSVGALFLLAAAEIVVFGALPMLAGTTRMLSLASLSPAWSACLVLGGVGVGISFAAGAIWWLPRRAAAREGS